MEDRTRSVIWTKSCEVEYVEDTGERFFETIYVFPNLNDTPLPALPEGANGYVHSVRVEVIEYSEDDSVQLRAQFCDIHGLSVEFERQVEMARFLDRLAVYIDDTPLGVAISNWMNFANDFDSFMAK